MAKLKTCGKDLSGMKFGSLLVLEDIDRSKNGSVIWLCLCDCGNFVERVGSDLTRRYDNKSCAECQKLPKGEGATNSYYLQYKKSAELRNLKFNITIEQFKELITQNCHFCDDEPVLLDAKKYDAYNGSMYANGIDRLDSKKGYNLNNIVPCCKFCNMAKLDMSKEQFLKNVKRVVEFQKK